MWLLVIILLSTTPPYKSRGAMQIPYTSESECKAALTKIVPQMDFRRSKVTASCSFRGYVTDE